MSNTLSKRKQQNEDNKADLIIRKLFDHNFNAVQKNLCY